MSWYVRPSRHKPESLDDLPGVEPGSAGSEPAILPLDDRSSELAHSKGIKPLLAGLESARLSESRVHKLADPSALVRNDYHDPEP